MCAGKHEAITILALHELLRELLCPDYLVLPVIMGLSFILNGHGLRVAVAAIVTAPGHAIDVVICPFLGSELGFINL